MAVDYLQMIVLLLFRWRSHGGLKFVVFKVGQDYWLLFSLETKLSTFEFGCTQSRNITLFEKYWQKVNLACGDWETSWTAGLPGVLQSHLHFECLHRDAKHYPSLFSLKKI